ncbi:uncharacterized protein [Branchiostoma lanceolatum]|uniref:uncharacterized protein isoform X1 n=1 Tax=Branchiostoma lanceolatum TaxID=7740 RepID=UPI003451A365
MFAMTVLLLLTTTLMLPEEGDALPPGDFLRALLCAQKKLDQGSCYSWEWGRDYRSIPFAKRGMDPKQLKALCLLKYGPRVCDSPLLNIRFRWSSKTHRKAADDDRVKKSAEWDN